MTTPIPQGDLTVAHLCTLARVSRAGYYRSFRASAPRQEETCVRDAVQRIALKNRFYGYRRILVDLGKEGFDVNHKRVLRLMRQDNLLCLRKKPFVPVTTQSQHRWPVVPNLARFMVPTGLNQLWVADITYVRMLEEFAYLAIVLDAFSRRVVGWELDDHLNTSLPLAALKTAIETRRPTPGGLVHHSDRGVQYASGDYTVLLQAHGIIASMSRAGNPYDNAKAESFMKTLKHEEVDGSAYRDVRHARAEIGSFIEGVYNPHRLHSALDYRSPIEFEAQMRDTTPAIAFARAMGFQGIEKSTAMNEEPSDVRP